MTIAAAHIPSASDARSLLDATLDSIRASASRIADTVQTEVIQNITVLRALTSQLENGVVLVDKEQRVAIINSDAPFMEAGSGGLPLGYVPQDSATSTSGVKPAEVHIVSTGGAVSKVTVKASGLEDEDGKPFSLVITRSVKPDNAEALNHLNEMRDLYNVTLWNMPVAAFFTDAEGNTLRGSSLFYDLVGLTPTQVSGRSIEEFLSKDNLAWYYTHEEKSTGRVLLSTAEGSRSFKATKALVKTSDGSDRALGFVTSLADDDLSDCPQAETVTSSFLKTFDVLDTPMVLVSIADPHVLLVNKAFCTKYGFCRFQLVGKRPEEFVVEKPTGSEARKFISSLAAGRHAYGQFTIRNAEGKSVTLRAKALAVPGGDRKTPLSYCLLTEC